MERDTLHAKGDKLLEELDCLLSECSINEIGFVPTTVDLHATSGEGPGPSSDPHHEIPSYDKEAFWCGDGKLAIAYPVLVSLSTAATTAFRRDSRLWRKGQDTRDLVRSKDQRSDSEASGRPKGDGCAGVDNEEGGGREEQEERLMRWSRVVLLLNSDHATAWNTRKRILLRKLGKGCTEAGVTGGDLSKELWLSEMVLSLRPKSGDTWAHRRWVLQQKAALTSQPITTADFLHESALVQRAAERNVMNYRAWSHRCRLIPLLSWPQVAEELERTTKWVRGQPADSCGFHYRRCLLECLPWGVELGDGGDESRKASAESPVATLWKREEALNTEMILRFPGREALWTHRRFLFLHACRSAEDGASSLVGQIQSGESDRSAASREPAGMTPGGSEASLIGSGEMAFVARCVEESEEDGTENGREQRRLAAAYQLWCLHVLRDFDVARHLNGWEYNEEVLQEEEAVVRSRLAQACPWMSKLWASAF